MDLPTYTNIWRIEKRLYKLYDLRLPMPLPIVWIGVFVGVFVPWSLLLVLVGVPVEMPWHVLYLVPPGIVTWLSTRPVIEGKRLTELLESHLRYLGEPKAWYRLTPGSEPDTVTFSGRVWRTTYAPARSTEARKARRPQRRREGQRITGPRQVRPAVAAAAAAAAQAPVAEPATRTGWGSRRGAAPALRARVRPEPVPGVAASPPRREDGLPARSGWRLVSLPGPAPAADPPEPAGVQDGSLVPSEDVSQEAARSVREPAVVRRAPQADPDAMDAEAVAGDPGDMDAEVAVAREVGVPIKTAESRRPAAGKPIDTEALRRLRRLAASVDAPADLTPADLTSAGFASADLAQDEPAPTVFAPAEPVATESPERVPVVLPEAVADVRDEDAYDEEVARDQHRKGQPPRVGPAKVLAATGQVWPALTPEGKPLPRPATDFHLPAHTTTPAKDASSTPVKDAGPTPVKDAGPTPVKDAGPTPVKDAGPTPVKDAGPTPVKDAGPAAGSSDRGAAAEEGEGAFSTRAGRGEAVPAARDGSDAGSDAVPVARQDAAEGVRRADAPGERRGAPTFERPRRVVGDGGGELVAPVPGPRPGEGRVRRVESVVGRDSGGWRRIAQVVVGNTGGMRTDGSEIDEARARGVFAGGRRVVVLGCTGGAGQTTTALMLGHTFAKYRDDRVVAVDANTGGGTLTSKIQPETPETLTSLLSGLDRVSGYLTMRGYTTRTASGLEVISADTDAGAEQRLADRSFFSDHRLGESMRLLDRHYKLAVIDPAAALAARLLPYADQLVLVVPASEEAPEAVAMTYEWLDGHGCAELRRRAVMVVNGVSRRSMADVEQAESVARGRCRAIVRVPWEDDLAPEKAEVVDPGQLRAAGRRAYLALAGVVVAGFAAQTVRPSEEELASDPPGTRIGER
ncbi:conjugal transfer protein [Nonomuraea maritima]|uniref:conjugal transfer protein n=1 Tax=Nonomuraea maritima TaxID=683260 RepID=UPI00159FD644|nr:conjugal transfer protein [Nonomuraea maritima]